VMRLIGENEKARALGYLDGRAGRPSDCGSIPWAQLNAYNAGFRDGTQLLKSTKS